MRNGVKALFKVGIQNVRMGCVERLPNGADRLMRVLSRTKTKTALLEIRLKDQLSMTIFTAIYATRSRMIGIPNGLCFPSNLGM